MKKAIAILAVLSLAALAGQVAVESGSIQRTDADWLNYDDGTYHWLTWGGLYRGVWFNIDDFVSDYDGAEVEESEFWFYHHSSYPWDTADFYAEIWNGDNMGPTAQLDQTLVTAIHCAPVGVVYSPALVAEGNFWALINTEMSAEGWPSVLGDNTPPDPDHSFHTDDFIVWEPWGNDYFIAVLVEFLALDNSTWGSLKATF